MLEKDSNASSKRILALLQSKADAGKHKSSTACLRSIIPIFSKKRERSKCAKIFHPSNAIEVYTAKDRRILEWFSMFFG